MLWRWVQFPSQRKIGKPLLCNVRVFVFLVRTQGIQRLDTKNANNPTKYVGLLEVNIDKLLGTLFHMFDGFADVGNFQFRRQWNRAIESVCLERHLSNKVSRFQRQGK